MKNKNMPETGASDGIVAQRLKILAAFTLLVTTAANGAGIELISERFDAPAVSTSADSHSGEPAVSGDGTVVVFSSKSTNLVPGNFNGFTDHIFVFDTKTGVTEHLTPNADNNSYAASINFDGTVIAFQSRASNLVAGGDGTYDDIYVYDRTAGSIELVTAGANSVSFSPSVSGDGNLVAFASRASNLDANDSNGALEDIFIHDRDAGTTSVVTAGATGTSTTPAISADGTTVAFSSNANDLVTGDNNGFNMDVFVVEVGTNNFELLTPAGNDASFVTSISGDGTLVAFQSAASNLVGNDGNGNVTDIFVHDRSAAMTTNITPTANNHSFSPSVSADGSVVVFMSRATNLAAGDTNSTERDIFLYDRTAQTTELITAGGNRFSINPSTSADGNTIAFQSRANNLVASDNNNDFNDIFLFDRGADSTSLASIVSPYPSNGGNSSSGRGSIDDSGNLVAFESFASNIVAGDMNGEFDIFVRNRSTGTTQSLTAGGNGRSEYPAISGDGTAVVFLSRATNLVAGMSGFYSDVLVHDLVTGNKELLTPGRNGSSSSPSISADGNLVVFASRASNLVIPDGNGTFSDIFLYNRTTGAIDNLTAGATGTSINPEISADGSTVVFVSNANDIVSGDNNGGVYDVFVHNVSAGTTELVTAGANSTSSNPVVNADGSVIAFASDATNLVPGDTNGRRDVFVHTRPGGLMENLTQTADSSSVGAAISDDGTIVSFHSGATNLVTNDSNANILDVFIHDRTSGTTTLLSVDGNQSSQEPSLSANGEVVAFWSGATNLSDDGNGLQVGDVFVFDPNYTPNNQPLANHDAVTTNEDVPIAITLTGSDADNDPLTFAIDDNPINGSVNLVGDVATYAPTANYNGSDSFTFTTNDGTETGAPATISITVTPVNDPPVATDLSDTVAEDTSVNISLIGIDPENDPLTFMVSTPPADGSVIVTGNIATYTPDANFNGSDNFEFTANDGTVDSAPATVSITITPVNDPPTADPTSAVTDRDVPVAIALSGADLDGDPLTFAAVPGSGPSNGSVTVAGATATYTPNPGFVGSDSFHFVSNDNSVDSPPATVSITVNDTNSAPTADNDAVVTDEDTPLPITLTGSDPDNDPLTFTLTGVPTHGTLGGVEPNLTYTPDPDYFGPDSLMFLVNDGEFDSPMATVNITVNPVNDAPVTADVSAATNEDMAVAVTLAGTDVENDALTYSVTGGPANGTLSGTAPNLTYLPNPGFTGTDTFTYLVNDGEFDSNTATVDIEVGMAPPPDYCYEPDYDRFTERGLFFWGLCNGSNRYKLRVTGGGTTTRIIFEGRLEANGGANTITPISIESDDVLDDSVPDVFSYRLKVNGTGQDGVDFTVNGSPACMLFDLSNGEGVFLGENKTPLTGDSLNLLNGEECGTTPPGTEQPIDQWTNHRGNVTTTGNVIDFTGSPNGWQHSVNSVPLSDFGVTDNYEVRFAINSDPSSAIFLVGLGLNETNHDWRDVDHGFRVRNGLLEVVESGVWQTSNGSVTSGDEISISVSAGAVEYRKNGAAFHTFFYGNSPSFYIDTAFRKGQTSLAVTLDGASAPGLPTPITDWSNVRGAVTQSGDSISYDGSLTGWRNSINSALFSTLGITGGFGVSWEVGSNPAGALWTAGIGDVESAVGWQDIEYAFRSTSGTLTIYESGTYRGTFGSVVQGDTLSIRVDGSSLEYRVNGTTVFTRAVAPNVDYYIDTAFKFGAITLDGFRVEGLP